MRKRINRVCIASSNNYTQSRKTHRVMLEENHVNNNALFLVISTTLTPKTLSPLERFEAGLIKQVVYFVTNGGAIQCYTLRDFIEIYPNHTIRTTVDFDLEEDRTIQLSKDTAKEWYKGNNETLKQLALTVYKPEELSFGYKDITLNSNLTSVNVDIPTHLANKNSCVG